MVAGASRADVHHACVLFEDEGQRRDVVSSFLRDALASGAKALWLAERGIMRSAPDWVRSEGIATDRHFDERQISIMCADDVYLENGRFDPERMMRTLRTATETALREGYSALHVTGTATWALAAREGVDRLIEYETNVNAFLEENPCRALCQYDRRAFSPAGLLGALRTHPSVLAGSQVLDNLYYVPAESAEGNGDACALESWLANLRRYSAALGRAGERAEHAPSSARRSFSEPESIVPICAGCKSIRDEAGRWSPIEAFLSQSASVQLSHCLCPECLRRAQRELAEWKASTS